ncbi:hypothetical protein ABT297_25080 [Dactylosporangium sp. NPDC000555]|uniref:hypothetical protein n=1 Tax=Dactylosporangium sp. NPDC000555 TaxID=3154260 RepID=UPI00331EE1B0
MKQYVIEIYRNSHAPLPYETNHQLTLTFSYWLLAPGEMAPREAADFAAETFCSELDVLEDYRGDSEYGEEKFLAACTYHLLGNRRPTIGDVFHIAGPALDDHLWLALERRGWRTITSPTNVDGEPLTAAKVLRHLGIQR